MSTVSDEDIELFENELQLFLRLREYHMRGDFIEPERYAEVMEDLRSTLDSILQPRTRVADLEQTIDWLRQTVHRAHHDGDLDTCRKNTCDAALKALGRR